MSTVRQSSRLGAVVRVYAPLTAYAAIEACLRYWEYIFWTILSCMSPVCFSNRDLFLSFTLD